MADYADDESKIITKFLLNTCRLLQPTVLRAAAAAFCATTARTHPPDDDEVVFIPLLTGSVAEFYIQPMLSCVGDIDMMYHYSNETGNTSRLPTAFTVTS